MVSRDSLAASQAHLQKLQSIEMQIQVVTLLLDRIILDVQKADKEKEKVKNMVRKLKLIDDRKAGLEDGKRFISEKVSRPTGDQKQTIDSPGRLSSTRSLNKYLMKDESFASFRNNDSPSNHQHTRRMVQAAQTSKTKNQISEKQQSFGDVFISE